MFVGRLKRVTQILISAHLNLNPEPGPINFIKPVLNSIRRFSPSFYHWHIQSFWRMWVFGLADCSTDCPIVDCPNPFATLCLCKKVMKLSAIDVDKFWQFFSLSFKHTKAILSRNMRMYCLSSLNAYILTFLKIIINIPKSIWTNK